MVLFVVLLAHLFAPDSAQATTIRKLSLDELISSANDIVVGKCEKKETAWIEKRIFTISTIAVSHGAKGDAAGGQKIKVYTLGGSVKEPLPVTMHVPGAETMAVGEDMLLFLERFGDKKQFRRVVGMSQGKLPVADDSKTGQKAVGFELPVKGVRWVDKNGKAVAPDTAGAQEEPAPEGSLEGFLGRIHKIKAEQEKRKQAGGTKGAGP
ncbi:MAG TPA: hypothetical protein PLU30_22460 [Verrucomicrobiae bacterium]|nr:hypothetical protein [Verrucomicrobiae bacterium]